MYDFVVTDAMNLAYRSWWAVRNLMTTTQIHTGLEYGFLKNFLANTRQYLPAKQVLAWDGRPTKGLDLHSEYKANRKKIHSGEAPWGPRLARLRDLLAPIVLSLYHPEEEADEQIARFVKQKEKEGKRSLIISTDKDFHQLVSDLIHIKNPDSRSTDTGPLDKAAIEEKWKLPKEKIVFFRCMDGDKSDEIPGIPRLPETTKIRLASKANTIEDLISLIETDNQMTVKEREKLRQGKDIIRRNYKMMNLKDWDEPPTQLKPLTGDVQPLLEFCHELELKSLVERKEWKLFSLS